MYCAASLCDIGISQRANPVQNGSTCIVAGDAAGRACTSLAQQEEPAEAWRSRKSLHKRGTVQEACQNHRDRANRVGTSGPDSTHPWKQH